MRAKTVRPSSSIPVKRTSEGVETTRKNEANVDENTATVPVLASIFPVKSVLKKSEMEPRKQQQLKQQHVVEAEFDKENINPINIDWDDLDAEDAGDPLMVSDYVVEIFDYMTELEVKR